MGYGFEHTLYRSDLMCVVTLRKREGECGEIF
jgi:hypothetical protein